MIHPPRPTDPAPRPVTTDPQRLVLPGRERVSNAAWSAAAMLALATRGEYGGATGPHAEAEIAYWRMRVAWDGDALPDEETPA